MTDLLDRPVAAERGPDPEPDASAAAPAREPRLSIAADQWLLAALLAGAAAIHVAMTPSHLGESAVEGAGFLVSAWVQLGLAVAVLLRRPSRLLLAAIAGASTVLIAAWVVSRTAGLPFGSHSGHAESVSIVDGVCVGLEAVATLMAVGLLTRVAAGFWKIKAVALVGVLGALGLTTAAVASPAARDHAAHSHGAHGAEGAAGHSHGAAGEDGDDLGFSELSNGHQHAHTQDEPLTPAETRKLSGELAATAELVDKYPTIADAEAAGWRRAGPFSPGLGTHYMSPDYVMNSDGDMDPADLAAPMLVFDGTGQDAQLAGFMYNAYGTEAEPSGFTGPNDHWHYHENVCIVRGDNGTIDTPFGADLEGVTEKMCTDVGGSWIAATGYMVHVWNVPGYESPDGMFTELNPRITCPDGTYHRIPIEDLGTKDTVCLNP
jgi:hypothetical protein